MIANPYPVWHQIPLIIEELNLLPVLDPPSEFHYPYIQTYSAMKGPPTGVDIIIYLSNQSASLFMHWTKSTDMYECVEPESISINAFVLQMESRHVATPRSA